MPFKKIDPTDGIVLPTDSFYGDLREKRIERRYAAERFCFPEEWKVWGCEPEHLHAYPPLSEADLLDLLEHPIDSPPLPELVRGRRSAAIIVDDLSRPTPAHNVLPLVIEQLKKGGMAEKNIFFIVGCGQHRPIARWGDMEKVMKLGSGIVQRFDIFDHDALDEDTYDIEQNGGLTIRLNKHLRDADLVIGVGGIYPHGGAGFGGGAKIMVPGVSHQETIRYNHDFPWEGYGKIYPENIEHDCIRKDAERVARHCLHFLVNLVVDPYKRIIHLTAGHFIAAHRQGCRIAQDAYVTNLMPEHPDLVVANTYPFDTDLGQSGRGSRVFSHHESSIHISIAPCYDQIRYHGHPEGWRAFLRRQEQLKTADPHHVQANKEKEDVRTSFLYSLHLHPRIYYQDQQSAVLFDRWDELIKNVKNVCSKAHPTVALYPYSSLQLFSDQ